MTERPIQTLYTLIMAASVCVALLSGCDQNNRGLQQKLSVVVREGLEANGIRRVAEEWGKRRGVNVVVDALGRSTYETVTKATLQSTSPNYDVVFFPGTEVAEMAEKSVLDPIRNWTAAADPDLLAVPEYKGIVYALPCDISTFFTFYRRDVVRELPETWADLERMAPTWVSKPGTPGRIKYGLAFSGQAGEELPKIFYPILWSYGGYVINDGNIGIESPEAVAAADQFRRLAKSPAVPAEIETWNALKILDEWKAGTIAYSAPQWNALYPLIKDSSDPSSTFLDIAQLPGVRQQDGSIRRSNFIQTWVLVKPKMGGRLDLANDFILFATGQDGARLYAESERGNPARTSILSDSALQQRRPEFDLMLSSIRIAQAEPVVPYYSSLHQVMNEALGRIIATSDDPKLILSAAARNIRTIMTPTTAK